MINFRFHLVSLVAVFLALGVGVAMGASFIDRATVETLRNRVDDLEDSYRRRGTEIDELRDHMRADDDATTALLGEGSALLAGRLEGRNLVVVAPAELGAEAVDATWSSLEEAGAVRAGTVRLEPSIALTDDAVLERARELVSLGSASPTLVRQRVMDRLASSFAALTAGAPAEGGQPNGTTPDGGTPDGTTPADPTPEDTVPGEPPDAGAPGDTTTVPTTTEPEFRPEGPDPTPEELAEAREFLTAAGEAGIISIGTGGADEGAAFPELDRVSYVMLLEIGTPEDAVTALHELSRGVAAAAPATVTVAETADPRAPGELPSIDADRAGSMLVALRNDDEVVDRLSTIDHLDDIIGRAALVLTVEEQATGEVGHYGTGVGANTLVPQIDG